MSTFTADDGTPIPVHISGQGKPMVLLHGWTANHLEWSLFLRGLQPHHRLYRWEARGHSAGAATPPSPDLRRMARDLHNLLTHYDLQEVTLVGHSMGALTLWQYLQDFGDERVQRLCIIDQSPKLVTDDEWPLGIYGDFDHAASERFKQLLREDFAEGVLRLVGLSLNAKAQASYHANGNDQMRTRALLKQANAEALTAIWDSLVEADFRLLLDKIKLPALLIYGSESNFYPLPTGNYVAERMQNAELKVYAGEDHSPHLWQRDRFLHDLLTFCSR